MATSTIKDVDEGEYIIFQSKNPNDTVVWKGKLEGKVSYKLARQQDNPAPYNTAVRQVDNSVSANEAELTYFIITVDNGADVPPLQVFADEWIQPGSLQVINPANKVKLLVTDQYNDSARVISALANAGYSARIIS